MRFREPSSGHPGLFWRYRHLVAAAALTLVIVGGMIGAAIIIAQLRRDAADTLMRTTLANIAIALSESVGGLVKSIDITLISLSRHYDESEEHFAEEATALIKELGRDLVVQLSLTDRDGQIIYSTQGPASGVSIRDREHFKVHLDPARDDLYISRQVIGRVSGKPSIQFSRKITRHGEFAGVIVLSVSPDYFVRLFGKLDIGDEGAVSLFRQDGAMLARGSYVPSQIDMTTFTIRDRPFLGPDAPVSGFYDTNSQIDGLRRTGGFRRVDGFPLVVVALLSQREIEADLQRHVVELWTAVGILGPLTALALLGGGVVAFRIESRLNAAMATREAMLVHAAATDPLTGLPNRLTFSRQMTEAFERARRLQSTFGIVAIDLDHFKAINDGYGHKAGDDVLIAVAKALSREVRASDLCARLGGEELAILLPGVTLNAACGLAERVRLAIARLEIPGPDGHPIAVTASFGVAVLNEEDRNPGQVLDRADRALYRAKHAGRDRVLADLAEA